MGARDKGVDEGERRGGGQFVLLLMLNSVAPFCLFLIHMSIVWIYVMSCVQPTRQPTGQPVSCTAKTLMLDIACKLFNQILSYLPCLKARLTSTILYCFTDLDVAWGSQAQRNAKLLGFIFSHTFHLIKMEFDVVMKQFKLNILRLLLSKIY